ncbi:hypothetical protein ACWCV2_17225 [Streptomyces pseudogriseolus]|uniref:hypothetical protein n=1 Tax=Streptomyces pseudogriseolus TaxID=36817 RepID=UPI003FA2D4E1
MVARLTAAQYRALMERRGGTPAPAAAKKTTKARRGATNPGPPSVPPPPTVEPLLAGLPNPGRHWTFLMPYAVEMLTSNKRYPHWSVEHRIRKQLRADATSLIRPMNVPRLQYAAIYYVLHPRKLNRSRDPGNWAPTAKAYVDGLVTPNPDLPGNRHLLPDDDHEHLLGPYPLMGAPVETGYARMSLIVVELGGPLTSANGETVTGTGTSTYRN